LDLLGVLAFLGALVLVFELAFFAVFAFVEALDFPDLDDFSAFFGGTWVRLILRI
jgi:hypothetical protein